MVSKQAYYPYGTPRSVSASVPTERQYTGQVSDTDETGLYYYNARYYNPSLSKFTQADTKDALQNRYAYVGNNPLVLVDPSGHQQARFDNEGFDNPNQSSFWDRLGYAFKALWNDPIYKGRVLGYSAVGAVSAATFTAPVWLPVVEIAAPVIEFTDTLIDTVQCTSGDMNACGYIANPLPGASLADDLAGATTAIKRGGLMVDDAVGYALDLARARMKSLDYADEVTDLDLLSNITYVSGTLLPYDSRLAEAADNAKTFEELLTVGGGVCRHQACYTTEIVRRAGFEGNYYRFSSQPDAVGHAVSLVNYGGHNFVLDAQNKGLEPYNSYMSYFKFKNNTENIYDPKIKNISGWYR